ncbi:Response regulator [Acanthopleuribacter pedis]|uniref:Response regulator n=1 Tax=Acanthopleuribacter pedis TaxID=442870 RepID=A0A8J7QQF6_9BACT|nr:response regulator [Acanthopleuribacter pedis]MBO1322703.1 response regulator [Acanthopleuribacter pedis]
MSSHLQPVPILMADDDQDDCLLAQDALDESRLTNPIFFVHDGIALLDFLHNRGAYADKKKYPRPGLILLDLNMPRMDGRTALTKIKEDSELRLIPVVILTTSKQEQDVFQTYGLGANSFITKPVEFDDLVKTMRVLGEYWFSIVRLA